MIEEKLTGYQLSHDFFNWAFENPNLITPNHIAMYFFAIEHCNRLGWKKTFGLPTEMCKEAIGIRNYKTYINTLSDLTNWGFIKWVEKSKNQYSANVIALVKNTKALTKALDRASLKHGAKLVQSIDSIDKHITNEHLTKETYRSFKHLSLSKLEYESLIFIGYKKPEIDNILDAIENYKNNTRYTSLYLTAKKWLEKDKKASAVPVHIKKEQPIPEPSQAAKNKTVEDMSLKAWDDFKSGKGMPLVGAQVVYQYFKIKDGITWSDKDRKEITDEATEILTNQYKTNLTNKRLKKAEYDTLIANMPKSEKLMIEIQKLSLHRYFKLKLEKK